MTTLRAVSKEEFRSSDNISTCEQIRTGSLQRIADATEVIVSYMQTRMNPYMCGVAAVRRDVYAVELVYQKTSICKINGIKMFARLDGRPVGGKAVKS